MAIQMRRGNNAYYDESKMKPGEVAVATDTRQAYVGMGNGNAEELAFKRDLEGFGSGGTTDHEQLTNRDAADQHPISAITGLSEQLLRPGVNLLHNADWAYSLVNQRGHSGAVSDAYCIDRWIGNGNVTPIAGQYVSLAKNTTMTQRMEILPAALGDKQLSFSIDIDGETQSVPIIFPSVGSIYSNGISLDGCDVELGFVESSGTSICGVQSTSIPYLKITPTSDINVKRPFLEFGKVSHMEETTQKDIVLETLTCQRYCKVLGRYAMYRASVVSKNGVLTTLPIAVQMRTTPSIESGSFLIRTLANAEIDGFNFSIGASGVDFIRIDATKTSHGLTDAALRTGTAIVISADL